jgi:predicted transport protein
LIAESFSDSIRELTTLVTPDVELYAYRVIEFKGNKKGIVYFSVSKPKIENEEIQELPKIEGHYNYLKNEELKKVIDNIRNEIKQFDESIEEYITHSYIGFKYKGRAIASISVQRQSFDLYANILADEGYLIEYYSQRIKSKIEDYKDTLNKIRENYSKIQLLKK